MSPGRRRNRRGGCAGGPPGSRASRIGGSRLCCTSSTTPPLAGRSPERQPQFPPRFCALGRIGPRGLLRGAEQPQEDLTGAGGESCRPASELLSDRHSGTLNPIGLSRLRGLSESNDQRMVPPATEAVTTIAATPNAVVAKRMRRYLSITRRLIVQSWSATRDPRPVDPVGQDQAGAGTLIPGGE